jgi:hypothetical protein
VARVLLNRVRLERTRQFGACYLGLQLWNRPGLDRFFEEAVDDDATDVPWSRVTALDGLLEIEEGKINDTRLYHCLDRILPHKTNLERHLKERYGELFAAEFEVLLYDLTSTYVESAAATRGTTGRTASRWWSR